MVGPCLDLGYNHGLEISWNVEAMRAKEAATKARKGNFRIDIVHK
jgi:hypothetical protein